MNKLNLRIIHTHDVEENWNKLTDFIPKAGEVIVYDFDDKHTYERFKIGDGVTNINDLPFTVDEAVSKLFNINNNIVYIDAGRI